MATRGNRNAVGNRGGGRPTSYSPSYVIQVEEIAQLGATDAKIAKCFGVSESTINTWKREHFEFAEALKKGKSAADASVVASLYHRALGYSHPAVKITVGATGLVTEVPYTEHYPPDTTACIFWLKNRRAAEWRDKREIEQTAPDDRKRIENAIKAWQEECPGASREDAIRYLSREIPEVKELGKIG